MSQIMGETAAETTNFDANCSEDEAARSLVEPSEHNLPAKPQLDLAEQSLRHSNEPAASETEAVSMANDDVAESESIEKSQLTLPVAPQQPLRRHGTAKPIV
jgi:hypothetical protein